MRLYFLSLVLVLILLGFHSSFAQQATEKLTPTDDAFILTNINDPTDRQGLQSLNTGNYKFVKIGYAWNTTAFHERIISAAVIKFDLSDLKSTNVTKADLMIYPFVANLTGVARYLVVASMASGNWTESTITFKTAPPVLATPIALASVSGAGSWVDFDITDFVKKNTGSKVSLEIVFKTMYPGSQENLAFYSKETDNQADAPYLQVEYLQPSALPFGLPSVQDYSLYIITGGIAVAGIVYVIFLRNRGKHKSRPKVISDAGIKKESHTEQTDTKQEPELGQTAKQDSMSENIQCKRCGKTILRGFKICPYCGNIRSTNFPL
jgi:hypothetical protein